MDVCVQGRCYPFWMEFAKCMSDAEHPKMCVNAKDDYMECLHHKKEVSPPPLPITSLLSP